MKIGIRVMFQFKTPRTKTLLQEICFITYISNKAASIKTTKDL